MMNDDWLSNDRMKALVRDGVLVSIDILIRNAKGQWLLAFRKNRPAKSTWFVPGGRVRKGETIPAAFERVMAFELGAEISYQQASFRGVFVHYYDDNRWGEAEYGTHYLVLAHELQVDDRLDLEQVVASKSALEQHDQFHWFTPEEAIADPAVHPYTKVYIQGPATDERVIELFPGTIKRFLA